jgi:hypothetical protein
MMDELIGRLVADSGVDRTAAHRAVGIVAQLRSVEAPSEKVRTPMQRPLSGTEAWLAAGARSARASIRQPLKFSREPEENAVDVIVGAIPRFGQFA